MVPEAGRLTTEQQIVLARRVAQVFGPCYGNVYYWPHFCGPYSYSFGSAQIDLNKICQKDFDEIHFRENAKTLDRFGRKGRAFPVREGFLRDIFPMSFLPEAHLRAPVEGTTFEGWQQRSGLGTLSEILPGYAAWEVPREAAEEAREILRRNNRLLAYIEKS